MPNIIISFALIVIVFCIYNLDRQLRKHSNWSCVTVVSAAFTEMVSLGCFFIEIRLSLVSTLSPGWTPQYLHSHFLLRCLLFPISSSHSNDMDLNRICGTSRLATEYLSCRREFIWVWNEKQHAPYYPSCSICCTFSVVVLRLCCNRKLVCTSGSLCVWSACSKVTLQWHSPLYHPDDLQ